MALARRYAGRDWLAAAAKGAVMSRAEAERHFQLGGPLPEALAEAVRDIERHLEPPRPEARDDVFDAVTNDADATIEVDGEAGLTAIPGARPRPSRTGSPHEMGQKPEVD